MHTHTCYCALKMATKMLILVLLCISIFLSYHINAELCAQGCACYTTVIECSGRGLEFISNFPTPVERSVRRFLLRRNPALDLTNLNSHSIFISLIEIDLTGKKFIQYLYFSKYNLKNYHNHMKKIHIASGGFIFF